MIQSGDRARAPYSTGAAALARTKWNLLGTEVLVGSPELARIGLIALALLLQTSIVLGPGSFRPAHSGFFAVLVAAKTLASLLLVLIATLDFKRVTGRRLRQALAIAGLLILPFLSVAGIRQGIMGISDIARGMPYTNDGAVMDLYAAQQVRQGHDPYLKTNIVKALADINGSAQTVTPIMDGQFRGLRAYPSDTAIEQAFLNDLRYRSAPGVPVPSEFESKYNYPSGSFLFILPFVLAGFHDMRFLYALAVLAMGAYICWRMGRTLRLIVPFLLLADVPVIAHLVGGQPDPIYALLLLIGYAEWTRRWVSPVSMGLAIATKQLAWFAVPFYLALVIHKFGWREGLRRFGVMGLVFACLNGPFIVQAPGAYLSSIAGPMSDPMFPLGVGIVAIFVSNVVPMLPKFAFTLAELGAMAGSIGIFLRVRWLTPASGIVLAMLPLFFSWRSLTNYFYLVPLVALGVALADSRRRLAESAVT